MIINGSASSSASPPADRSGSCARAHRAYRAVGRSAANPAFGAARTLARRQSNQATLPVALLVWMPGVIRLDQIERLAVQRTSG